MTRKVKNHQDTPWKSLLEVYFQECIEFFCQESLSKLIGEYHPFIDWTVSLPYEFELECYEEAHKIEQELAMSYVTTFECIAEQRG